MITVKCGKENTEVRMEGHTLDLVNDGLNIVAHLYQSFKEADEIAALLFLKCLPDTIRTADNDEEGEDE